MVLSDQEIEQALKDGLIIIDPRPAADFYSPSAVDLCLSNDLLIFKTQEELQSEEPGGVERSIVLDLESLNLREWLLKYAKPAPTERDGSYPFPPQTFLLGMTREFVEIPKAS
jgi:deoxycytidine triphosphate deaminase